MRYTPKPLNKIQTTLALSLLLFATMIGVAVFSDDGVMTVFSFKGDLEKLKENNESLVEDNLTLRREIGALKSDPLAVERVAREKLNLVRPGETVYQIVPHPNTP
ncbi:FtsB family cell division protein [Nitrospina watsonii]|uniref:Cell division protein ftsB homolog n=1 Tax=Nitrospina watsonii TaxID=1323948 RepID=A0ABM9HDH8_9BACT|nr:septum formation initiator family protein [Nitrospina watsonii]CAI2718214.1 Putative Cell division protein ftsB homolog [Nitrospina watsonii]